MRDYMVLWWRAEHSGDVHWYSEDPGSGQDSEFTDPLYAGNKVYVPVPSKPMLRDYFDGSFKTFPQNYVNYQGHAYSYADAWRVFFGGNTIGGYSSIEDVPTSDAWSFLHGRPARDENGQFIARKF